MAAKILDSVEIKRTKRRRTLSSTEIKSDALANQIDRPVPLERLQPEVLVAEIRNCKNRPQICGEEAACRSFENNTSKCVCPHDGDSSPTPDLKCPKRSIVPPAPRPIHNIIPPSGNGTNGTTIGPEAEQVERTRSKVNVPEIVGIALAFAAVLAILLGIVYCVRRRNYGMKTQRSTLEDTPMNLKRGLLLANKYTPNPQYFPCASPEVPILRRDCLEFLHDIGEGCFGKVYKGELTMGESKETVAIKVLKDTASREVQEDFMREVEIMSTFSHENILSLKGVVLQDSEHSAWMVFEFMPHGDLAEVLRANSKQFRAETPGLQPLSKESLHRITMQIAAGMTYLSAQRFVHRDLACRNCLVGSNLVVKIADFGMSRDVYTCDYYKIGGSRLLPVRWMSPESVMYGRFTLESDVWSFGVVLWEVYSYGKQPYYGHNNEEVVRLIRQGVMLIPPDECPSFVCDLMRECWRSEPRDRIKFPEILERLKKTEGKLIVSGALPRPPQGPITIRAPEVLDKDGYLVPVAMKAREYLQTLPDSVRV